MTHEERVNLIRDGINHPAGLWADLGCGKGAFTLALAESLHSPAQIYAIDKKKSALTELKENLLSRFPQLEAHFLDQDFTQRLDLPPLDGILIANALHYIGEKVPIIRQVYSYLKTGGRLILVEYNVLRSNPWVPYPISFREWKSLAKESGFTDTKLLGTQPSKYQHQFYAAVSRV
jgi:ubiquinone/menaquinone biosynthesis C-methylase UbiE